jgi:hypothetical protein
MKNRKGREHKRADKFVDDINAGRKSDKPSTAEVEVKRDIVRDIPNDMGRHGSDQEKELNPEE